MRKVLSLFLAFVISVMLCACSDSIENTTNETSESTEIEENLDPNLQRLQGNWAASENYEEDNPSFLCSMPATWDDDIKGYYVMTVEGNHLYYTIFHDEDDGNISKDEFIIKSISEVSSDEYQTIVSAELEGVSGTFQCEFVLYDIPERDKGYKGNFMFSGLDGLMLLELDEEQYNSIMDIYSKVKHDIEMSLELEPYIGMPKEQLENSTWGKPEDINITKTKNYIQEQWCYSDGRYVYVENGIVTTIQE